MFHFLVFEVFFIKNFNFITFLNICHFTKWFFFKNEVFYILFLTKKIIFDVFVFLYVRFFSFWSFFQLKVEKKNSFNGIIFFFNNVVFYILFLTKNVNFDVFLFSIFSIFQFLKFFQQIFCSNNFTKRMSLYLSKNFWVISYCS